MADLLRHLYEEWKQALHMGDREGRVHKLAVFPVRTSYKMIRDVLTYGKDYPTDLQAERLSGFDPTYVSSP